MVRFEGEGSGEDVLSWGQAELWGGMVKQRSWMPLRFVRPLAAGTTVEDMVAELRYLMGRYQTLRTRLRFDPDRPRQVVARTGEVPLELVEAGGADPAEVADQVAQRYWDRDYDFVSQWPVRAAVVRHRGAPTHLVLVMCHLVTDAFGATVAATELAERVETPVTALEPLAQARWQRSAAGQRQCANVLRRWERLLREIPPARFPAPVERPQPRYWHARYTSPATHLAVQAIAARTGVDAAPVLLAVFAVALARATGINPVATRVVASNRFRSGLAGTVSPISQSGLCVIDVDGITVDQAVDRAGRRAMAAYKYAYYDPRQMDALVTRVGRERGEAIELGCFFNDRRLGGRTETAAVLDLAQVRAAPPRASFQWRERQDEKPYEPLFVHVDDVPDTVALSVFTDTHIAAPATVEASIRGMEEVAVAAASDPDTPTGVPA